MLEISFKQVIWIALIVLVAQLTFAGVSYALPLPRDYNSLPPEALPSSDATEDFTPQASENVTPSAPALNTRRIQLKKLVDSFIANHPEEHQEYDLEAMKRFNDELYGETNN